MIRTFQVNLAEDLGTTEGCSEVIDMGKGGTIGFGMVSDNPHMGASPHWTS